MPGKEIILTHKGLEKLEKELQYLKTIKRREVAARIRSAIAFGDISENSDMKMLKTSRVLLRVNSHY